MSSSGGSVSTQLHSAGHVPSASSPGHSCDPTPQRRLLTPTDTAATLRRGCRHRPPRPPEMEGTGAPCVPQQGCAPRRWRGLRLRAADRAVSSFRRGTRLSVTRPSTNGSGVRADLGAQPLKSWGQDNCRLQILTPLSGELAPHGPPCRHVSTASCLSKQSSL